MPGTMRPRCARRLAEARRGDHGHRDQRRAVERRPRRRPRPAIDAVMARDAPHRPDDEPAQGRLGAVAHQPRRRSPRPVAAQRRDGRACWRAPTSSPSCRAAPSTSPTPPSASSTTIASASARAKTSWPRPARRSAGATCVLDAQARTVRFAARRHAHRPRRLRQGPRGRQRRGDPARASASRHAMVSAGGDSRVIGDRRGRPWTIGIARSAPRRRDGRGAAARGRRRSRPRATTSAISTPTACASTI